MVYGDISPKNTSTLLRILAEAMEASYIDAALETYVLFHLCSPSILIEFVQSALTIRRRG